MGNTEINLKNPISVSNIFKTDEKEATRVPDMMDNKGNIIISNWINDTSRPVQPLNERPIFHFDHTKVCGPPQLMAPEKKSGHYEKIRKAMTSYFYVSNNKPSGLPQAMVVSKDEAEGKGNKPAPRRAPVA